MSWIPDNFLDPVLRPFRSRGNFIIAMIVLFLMIIQLLDIIQPLSGHPKWETGLGLVFSAYVFISIFGFAWHRFEVMTDSSLEESISTMEQSIRRSAEEALGPYGEVSRVRGRDVFGPNIGPAERVTITLTLHKDYEDENANEHELKHFFSYSLEYDIYLGRELGSTLYLEILIAPIFVSSTGSHRHNCYINNIQEPWRFTIDLTPVIIPDENLLDMDPDERDNIVSDHVGEMIDKLEIESEENIEIYESNNREIVIGRIQDEEDRSIEVPIRTAGIPEGRNQINANIGPLKHPIEYPHFRLSSPMQTDRLNVICRSEDGCSLDASRSSQYVNAGECSQVEKIEIPEGYSWRVDNNWIIVPADWVEISFSSSEETGQ